MHTQGTGAAADPAARPRRGPWRQVALPNEHGAWAFLAEPVALGLLVAGSITGLLLALAATAGFLARRPLLLMVADRREGRRHPRTSAAEGMLALCTTAGATALVAALLRAPRPVLLTLLPAAPAALLAIRLDLDRRSRQLTTELAGALSLSLVAPAILLAGGRSTGAALGLWAVLAVRIVTSIFYVRARLRLERGVPAGVATALAVHGGGLLLTLGLAALGLAPRLAAGAVLLLGLRAVHGLSARRWRTSVRMIGVGEVLFGGVTILALAAGTSWRL